MATAFVINLTLFLFLMALLVNLLTRKKITTSKLVNVPYPSNNYKMSTLLNATKQVNWQESAAMLILNIRFSFSCVLPQMAIFARINKLSANTVWISVLFWHVCIECNGLVAKWLSFIKCLNGYVSKKLFFSFDGYKKMKIISRYFIYWNNEVGFKQIEVGSLHWVLSPLTGVIYSK